jgi:hypothetical protein
MIIGISKFTKVDKSTGDDLGITEGSNFPPVLSLSVENLRMTPSLFFFFSSQYLSNGGRRAQGVIPSLTQLLKVRRSASGGTHKI